VPELDPPIAAPLRDLTSERLSLERVTRDDLGELAAIFATTEVWEFPYLRGMTRDETAAFIARQTKLWLDHGFGGCATRKRADGELIGIVGLSVTTELPDRRPTVSVGWRLARTAWGNGYATEAATALLEAAFDTMQVPRVCCITQPENVRSVRVAQRLGMRWTAEIDVQPHDEHVSPVLAAIYEIEAAEWRGRRASSP
jgi:RimJ/RimL family protein N-acetyltransferase